MSYMTRTKRIIQFLLKQYLESAFQVEVKNNITKELSAPYLIIGNHQNNWDGFLMSIYVDEAIAFVISDEQYRNPIVRRLLQYINAIPTIKARVDVSTIKRILKAKKENRIIGLFPEGNRTWDGTTEPIYYSTSKLVKLLKLPVVMTSFKGGHLAHPRWAKHQRKGKIVMSYDLLFSEEEIEQLSVEQIYERLYQALEHDEVQWQKENMLPYKGKRLAEKLEYLLYTCPKCHTIDQMQSSENQFYCEKCGYSVEYNEYGLFEGNTESLIFDNVRDWNKWQLSFLEKLFSNPTHFDRLLIDSNITLKQGERQKNLRKVATGQISLDTTHFYFKPDGKEELEIPIDQIDGLNLQIRNQLDLYYQDELYRFTFSNSKTSPYKWFKALQIQKETLQHQQTKKAEA